MAGRARQGVRYTVRRMPATLPATQSAPRALIRWPVAFGLGDVLALTTVVLWGTSFTVIKAAYGTWLPLAFAAVRFVVATAALAVLLLVLRQPVRLSARDLPRALAVGVCHVGLYQIFFSIGLRDTTASHSVLIIATAPVLTALLVRLTRAEELRPRQWVGMVLAAGGVSLLVLAGQGVGGGRLRGDLLSLGAALAYAVTPVVALPLLRRYGTLPVMLVGMAGGTALLVAVAVPELLRQPWALPRLVWGQLLFAAVGAGALAYVAWYEGIKRIGAARAAAYNYLIPVLGVLVAVLVLGEGFGLLHVAAAAITLVGVGLVRWPA